MATKPLIISSLRLLCALSHRPRTPGALGQWDSAISGDCPSARRHLPRRVRLPGKTMALRIGTDPLRPMGALQVSAFQMTLWRYAAPYVDSRTHRLRASRCAYSGDSTIVALQAMRFRWRLAASAKICFLDRAEVQKAASFDSTPLPAAPEHHSSCVR